jgi:hypothetical protein
MYKMVKARLSELEKALNDAAAEGYTEVFREFPPPLRIGGIVPTGMDYEEIKALIEAKANEEPEYSYLMKKPRSPLDDFEPVMGIMQQFAAQLGMTRGPLGELRSIKLKKKRKADDTEPTDASIPPPTSG